MFSFRCRYGHPRATASMGVRPSLCLCALVRIRPPSASRIERLPTADLVTFLWLFYPILSRRPLHAKQRFPSGKSTSFPFALAATRPSFTFASTRFENDTADFDLFLSTCSLQVRQRPLLLVDTGAARPVSHLVFLNCNVPRRLVSMADTLFSARRMYTFDATQGTLFHVLLLARAQSPCLSRFHPFPRTPRLMLLLTLAAPASLILL
jgi:hypothetical protein